ncbi:MAG TPA: FliM/FliN family flagellar motor C-terminal domain-containing protein [Terriglobales bacterium]|nr:FliM/FliN family flagellar motor C-terminal domain-containing protein [Terriglobales bacterium]
MAEAAAARQSEARSPETVVPESADPWLHVLKLPCRLTVELPLPEFTVKTLMRLEPGTVIDSHWSVNDDVPLRVNGEVVAWSEFEVVGNRLAVRLTELA